MIEQLRLEYEAKLELLEWQITNEETYIEPLIEAVAEMQRYCITT
jgi:uncharacterized coiled-coil protein SlyX